jgi:tetratricopeptide (TPR) repeat protein
VLAGIAWLAALNAITWRAMQLDARVELPAEVVFSEAPMELPPARAADARAALAWYARASTIPEGISPFAFAQPRIDLQRAFLHAALHDMPQAERLYRRAFAADPALQSAAAGVARAVRADPTRQAEAAAFYDQVLAANPAWQPLREEQVAWLGTVGDYAAGIRSARAGLAAVPNLLAMRRLSLELTEHGAGPEEVAEGVALIRRTLEIEPRNAFAHAALARGLARLGQVDEAMAEFDRAIELDPGAEVLKAMRDEARANLR